MKYKNTLIIVPARGGSKGVKNKNIIELAGKPLIYYTIEPLMELMREGIIEKFTVSTDSDTIAKTVEAVGAKVPFLRPGRLAEDWTPTKDVLMYHLQEENLMQRQYDSIMLLQPTSPLRCKSDILNSLKLFYQEKTESLISVYHDESISDLILYRPEGNQGIPLNPRHNEGVRRQDAQPVYVRNGAIYIVRTDYFLKTQKLICEKPLFYLMPKSRSINIDRKEDLLLAQRALNTTSES